MAQKTTKHQLTSAGARLNAATLAYQKARRDGTKGAELARIEQEWYEAVRRLTSSLVRKFRITEASKIADLEQAAMEGALLAVDRYDPSRGAASALVTLYVKQVLHAEVAHQDFQGLTPHDFRTRNKLRKLVGDEDDDLTDEELAELIGVPAAAVTRVRGYQTPSSMNKVVGEDGGTEMGELIPDERTSEVDMSPEDRELLLDALMAVDAEKYDPISFFVTVCALGLHGEEPESLTSMRRALGRTNPESLRIRSRRTQTAMVAHVRANPEKFGLLAEDIGSDMDSEWQEALAAGDPIEMEVRRLRHEAESSGVPVAGIDWDAVYAVVRDAYEPHEAEMLIASVNGITDRPGPRAICGLCGFPNPPRQMANRGCVRCKTGRYYDPNSNGPFQGELPLFSSRRAELTLSVVTASRQYQERAGVVTPLVAKGRATRVTKTATAPQVHQPTLV